jgi:NAD(P)-dependent dehydrogenase (short-subunit alcohol dehydrogenase family)
MADYIKRREMATNSVVIVTGAASGIGLAMANGLLAAGHDVVAVDRNQKALEALAKSAEGKNGRVLTVTADLSHSDSSHHVVGQTLVAFGRIDALVNNAGIGQATERGGNTWQPINFWETTPEQWGRFIAVNAGSPINMARAVLPYMLAAKRGRIVTVTTSLGTMVRGGYLLYGSSKAAAESAMAILAAEVEGSGITSNVLVPGGMTDTAMVGESQNRDKMLRPEIMVAPLLWLLSDEAAAVNAKRFIAADWDHSIPPSKAAEKAGASIAWLDIARMPIEPK